jgi:AraC-like DNA-binding protein
VEWARYYRPLEGVEALHASFVTHEYRPHSHPTWTVAVMRRGAARFTVDTEFHRAVDGELFVLEPEAVHTGMRAVPDGWGYEVLYLEPDLISEWAEEDRPGPRAANWVVFRDRELRAALGAAHRALADRDLAVESAVAHAVALLRRHLRPGPSPARTAPEHAAVRRALAHLRERWDQPVSLAELAAVAGLSRFELVRCFSAQVGLPPHAFQIDLRIRAARARLAAHEPPAVVAAACGFADQAHLTRTFKRAVGVTPGRYRNAVQDSPGPAARSSPAWA